MGLPNPLIFRSAAHGRVARLTSKTRERDNARQIVQAALGKTLHRPGSRRARPTICVGLTKRSAISNHTIDVAM